MSTVSITFDEVEDKTYTGKKCCQCDRIIHKVLKRSQTINPWNQKTRYQIHRENRENLIKDEEEWQALDELCATCRKAQQPDVGVDIVTEEDWEATEKLRADIASLDCDLCKKRKELSELFKGRHLKVKFNGKERIGQITDVSTEFGTYIHYDILYLYTIFNLH